MSGVTLAIFQPLLYGRLFGRASLYDSKAFASGARGPGVIGKHVRFQAKRDVAGKHMNLLRGCDR